MKYYASTCEALVKGRGVFALWGGSNFGSVDGAYDWLDKHYPSLVGMVTEKLDEKKEIESLKIDHHLYATINQVIFHMAEKKIPRERFPTSVKFRRKFSVNLRKFISS